MKNLDLIDDKALCYLYEDAVNEACRRRYMGEYPEEAHESSRMYKKEILRRLTSPANFELRMTYAKEAT